MKQTAVEWLEEALSLAYQIEKISLRDFTIKKLFKQAKEMEKQQIGEAYEDGYSDSDNTFELNKEYYNEKFNK